MDCSGGESVRRYVVGRKGQHDLGHDLTDCQDREGGEDAACPVSKKGGCGRRHGVRPECGEQVAARRRDGAAADDMSEHGEHRCGRERQRGSRGRSAWSVARRTRRMRSHPWTSHRRTVTRLSGPMSPGQGGDGPRGPRTVPVSASWTGRARQDRLRLGRPGPPEDAGGPALPVASRDCIVIFGSVSPSRVKDVLSSRPGRRRPSSHRSADWQRDHSRRRVRGLCPAHRAS